MRVLQAIAGMVHGTSSQPYYGVNPSYLALDYPGITLVVLNRLTPCFSKYARRASKLLVFFHDLVDTGDSYQSEHEANRGHR